MLPFMIPLVLLRRKNEESSIKNREQERRYNSLAEENSIKYREASPYYNAFAFAEKYSSDDHCNNLFNIYLEKDDFVVMPGERVLAATIEYNSNIFILTRPEFYGPYLKMEFEKTNDNDSPMMNIYIHNTTIDTPDGIPNYMGLEHFYRGVFDYLGSAQLPIYTLPKNELIAIGIRSKKDFDLEQFYTELFDNRIILEHPMETLQMFEDYKQWILNAKNGEGLASDTEKIETEKSLKLLKNRV